MKKYDRLRWKSLTEQCYYYITVLGHIGTFLWCLGWDGVVSICVGLTLALLEGGRGSAYLRWVIFNAQKFPGSRDPGHSPLFLEYLSNNVRRMPLGNMRVKFEVRIALTVLELLAFNAPTVWLTGSLCTQTYRQTENNIFINSLHSLGGDKNISI